MSLHIPAVFEHITLDPDALAFAVAKNANVGAHYDWRTTYPVLAQLDKMNMRRTATIFADDCPNSAHDAYILEQISLPIDTGVSLMQAVSHHIPAAIKDLTDKTFAQWFSLSPVHWRAGRDHVNLVALNEGDINIEEAKVFIGFILRYDLTKVRARERLNTTLRQCDHDRQEPEFPSFIQLETKDGNEDVN